jgi:signal transduction histidine kinase
VAAGALLVRRRYPLAVLWVVTGSILLMPDIVPRGVFFIFAVAAYSAVAYSPYRDLALVILTVSGVFLSLFRAESLPTVATQAVPFLVFSSVAFAAIAVRTLRLRTAEGHKKMSALERDQMEALRSAVEHERARIARELHDVVTHNVSMMVIQAGAARKIMDSAPEQAKEAMLAVETGGRAAMAELRHVMGLLTMDSADPADPAAAADLTPQPGLDQLDAMVARVRNTGLAVALTVEGEPRPLPSGIGLAAYRVVQEALTNTVKYAVGADTQVRVAYAPSQLTIEVTDTGGAVSATATGNGRGLIGLTERLAVYGGTLDTGRRFTGGYRVKAMIPLEAAP